LGAEQGHGQWAILAVGDGVGICPDCGKQSERRHGWHERHLQDLPAQGAAVTVRLRIQRWQCRNKACKRQTLAAQLSEIVARIAYSVFIRPKTRLIINRSSNCLFRLLL
jgi:transposase